MSIVSAAIMIALLGSQNSSPGCDLAGVHSARELHDILNRRAVDIVAKAASDDWENDHELAQLI
jgi:hypothetical protein